jgi:hypothetical protein
MDVGGRWKCAGALAAAAVALSAGAAGAQQTGRAERRSAESAIAPEADRLLRAMSDYVSSLGALRVTADSSVEVVRHDGQKLQMLARSDVAMRRPDGLRSERRGEEAELALYYDGDRLTVHAPRANVFATASAPDTIDEAIPFARDHLGVEAPAADLLTSDPYGVLIADVRSGTYVGRADVAGVAAHHLAFRNRDGTDWQIWIQDGPTPLPLRYVVVSNDVRSDPEFEVWLHDWDTAPSVSEADFRFAPGPGARRIEFIEAGRRARRQQQR